MKIKAIIGYCLLINTLLFSDSNKELNSKVEQYILELKGNSTDSLIQLIIDGKKDMKKAAIIKLGELKARKAMDILISVMTYGWAPARYEKKYMPGKKKLVPELAEDVRAEAALALGKLKDPENISLIGNTILVDHNSIVKQYCLKALELIGTRECVPPIEEAIKYELSLNKETVDKKVVLTGIKVLGNLGYKEGFIILIEVTQSDKLNYKIKKEALRSLQKIRWE